MNGSTLPISVQASLLELNRSGLYYQPAPHATEDLYIKQMIDRIYTRYPMHGYRRICWCLNEKEHYLINHKAVLRHMQEMGIQAVYPRQNTSKPEPANKIYPYLLKGLKIDHPDQVWSIDITYIPVKTDWLYLVAIIDWYSRFVLHWQLSDTMEIGFVLDTSHKALKVSRPEIMNSDYAEEKTMPKNLITSCILIIRIQFFGIVFRVSQARRLLSLYQRSSTAFRHRQLWEQTC